MDIKSDFGKRGRSNLDVIQNLMGLVIQVYTKVIPIRHAELPFGHPALDAGSISASHINDKTD